MAHIPESDDELLDIYHGKVPLPSGWVRGKHAARYAAAAKPHLLHLSEPEGEQPTAGGGDPEQEAKRRAFHVKLQQLWVPRAKACTRPIWSWRDGRTQLAGTGTLFRVADSAFLVTASHVVLQSERDGTELLLTASGEGERDSLVLSGQITGNNLDDVAAWKLPETVAEALDPAEMLSFYQADRRNIRTGTGLYGVHGYPREYSAQTAGDTTPRIVRDSYEFVTGLYDGDARHVPRYDPRRHLLLAYAGVGFEPDGDPRLTPHLDGMSGSSIWQVYVQGLRTDMWTADFPVVTAVQTHVNRKLGYIRGTRWWVVDQLIREGWPHLAPALSLEVPDPAPA